MTDSRTPDAGSAASTGGKGHARRDLAFPLGLAGALLFILFYAAAVHKAPAIEADIATRASAEAKDALKRRDVTIEVDGRRPTAYGVVATEAERDRLLGRLTHDVWGALRPVDELLTAPQIDPYRLAATLSADRSLRVSGPAPTLDARDAIIDAAASVSPAVDLELPLAPGPDGETWRSVVVAGLTALGGLEAGTLSISGDEARLEGVADDDAPMAEIDAARAALESRGYRWLSEIRVAVATVAPYRFAATKSSDGSWRIEGYAADAAAMAETTARLRSIVGDEAAIELKRGEGMPRASWSLAVDNGLRALALADEGRIEILDDDGTATASLSTVAAQREFEALTRDAGGVVWTRDVSLKPGAEEAGGPARLRIVVDAVDGASLSGTFPGDLDAAEARRLLGLSAWRDRHPSDAATSGAAGDVDAWRRTLAAIGAVAAEFDAVSAEIDPDAVRVFGEIHAASDAALVSSRLADALEAASVGDASIELAAAATDKRAGARRTDPFDGGDETFRGGYWLPAAGAASLSVDACRTRMSGPMVSERIRFVSDSDALDIEARRALNALAALSEQCLALSDHWLEIGGHTDAEGGAEYNLALSERRATAVLNALRDRGVDADRLVAKGYGETQPVAANDAAEGRAANRRITFRLTAPPD